MGGSEASLHQFTSLSLSFYQPEVSLLIEETGQVS